MYTLPTQSLNIYDAYDRSTIFFCICHLAGLKNEFILPSIGKFNSQIKLHSMHFNNIICQYICIWVVQMYKCAKNIKF